MSGNKSDKPENQDPIVFAFELTIEALCKSAKTIISLIERIIDRLL